MPPMAKAMMSVAEVTVMAPPADAIVRANLSWRGGAGSDGQDRLCRIRLISRVSQHWKTNMRICGRFCCSVSLLGRAALEFGVTVHQSNFHEL